MVKKKCIQDKILKELYLRNSYMDVEKLSDELQLKDTQIRRAIARLSDRRLIEKKYAPATPDHYTPPYKKVSIRIRDSIKVRRFVREMLNAKGLL